MNYSSNNQTEEPPRPLSIREAALFFCLDRDTVRKRLQLARLQRAGERDGHPVYAVRDFWRAFWQQSGLDGELPPLSDIEDPFRRRAAIQAELLLIDLEAGRLEYIPALEVELEQHRVDTLMSAALDAVPAALRRAGLNDDAIAVAQREIATLRENLKDARP